MAANGEGVKGSYTHSRSTEAGLPLVLVVIKPRFCDLG